MRIIFTIVDDLVCPHTIIEKAQNSLECIVAIALNKICKYSKTDFNSLRVHYFSKLVQKMSVLVLNLGFNNADDEENLQGEVR